MRSDDRRTPSSTATDHGIGSNALLVTDEPRAQDLEPADPAVLRLQVRLLLDDEVAVGTSGPEAIGDVVDGANRVAVDPEDGGDRSLR